MSFISISKTDAALNQRRKAAMIVQLLLAEGHKLPLSSLPEDLQMRITRELGALRMVDRQTLHAVANEFAAELDAVGLTAPGGVERALAALEGQLSPTAAARLKSEAAQAHGTDPWAQIAALEAEDLLPLMTGESIEVCAVALSKLPVAKAAAVLALLPGERARKITYAVSQTGSVTPEAVVTIGRALAADHCIKPVPAFATPPVARVGAILNSSLAATRDDMLAGLGDDDPAFAEQVRRAIFTFPDIPERVAPVDVPKVLRAVDNAQLVTALASAQANGGADAASADFILANMSQRMAEALREEIGERGRIKKSDAEAAMGAVIAGIREKVDSGEVSLVVADDAEE